MLKKMFMLILFALLAVQQLPASGFTVYEQSASGTAMAGAVVATVDDASSVFYNPAAINAIPGVHVALGVSAINSVVGFTGPASLDAKQYNKSRHSKMNLSHLYVTYKYNNLISAGFGFFTPFAIKTNWQRANNTWEGQDLVQNFNLDTYMYNPVVSINVLDYATVAAGVSYVQSDFGLTNSVFFTPRSVNGSAVLDASGSGYGFNLAVQSEPLCGLHVGVTYRSSVELDFDDGSTAYDVGSGDQTIQDEFFAVYPEEVKTTFKNKLPSLLAVGLAYDFTNNMTIEADYLLSGYGALNDVQLNYARAVNGNATRSLRQNYKDTHSLRLGMKYDVDDKLQLRAGYFWDNTIANQSQANPLVPDMTRHNYSAGFGYRFAGFAIDGFYQVTLPDDRTVSGTEIDFDGTYSGLTTLYGMTLGYSF